MGGGPASRQVLSVQGPTRRWPHRPAVTHVPLRLRVPRVAFKGTRLLGILSARWLQAC